MASNDRGLPYEAFPLLDSCLASLFGFNFSTLKQKAMGKWIEKGSAMPYEFI